MTRHDVILHTKTLFLSFFLSGLFQVDCRVGILDRSLDQGRLVDYFSSISRQPNSKEKKKKNILYFLTEEKTRNMNEYINNCVSVFRYT